MNTGRRNLLSMGACLAAACAASPAAAQLFGSRTPAPSTTAATANAPIRIIVPEPFGGTIDRVARALGEGLASVSSKAVVVDNAGYPGAAVEDLLKVHPDSLTMLIATPGLAALPALSPRLLDDLKGVAPLGLIGETPLVLATQGTGPDPLVNSAAELIRWGQSSDSQAISLGVAGPGSPSHLCAALLQTSLPEANFDRVSYRTTQPMLADLRKATLDMVCETDQNVRRSGGQPLVVMSARRPSNMPASIPSAGEVGQNGWAISFWIGAVASPTAKADVRSYLSGWLARSLDRDEVKKALDDMWIRQFPADQASATRMRSLWASEIERWPNVLRNVAAVNGRR